MSGISITSAMGKASAQEKETPPKKMGQVQGNKLQMILRLLYQPVSVVVEKMTPSQIESYVQGLVKMDTVDEHEPVKDHVKEDRNAKDLKWPEPPFPLHILMILLLQNKQLRFITFSQLKKLICTLFPYFRTTDWNEELWISKFNDITDEQQCRDIFIKKSKPDWSNSKVLIKLNHKKRNAWQKLLQDSLTGHEEELKGSLSQPDLMEKMLQGEAELHSLCKSDCRSDGKARQLNSIVGKPLSENSELVDASGETGAMLICEASQSPVCKEAKVDSRDFGNKVNGSCDSEVDRTPEGDSEVDRTPEGDSEVDRTSQGDCEVDRTPEGDSEMDHTSQGDCEVDRTSQGDCEVDRTSQGDCEVDRTSQGDSEVDRTPEGDNEVDRTPEGDSEVDRTPEGDSEVDRTPEGDSKVDRTSQGDSEVDRTSQGDSEVDHTSPLRASNGNEVESCDNEMDCTSPVRANIPVINYDSDTSDNDLPDLLSPSSYRSPSLPVIVSADGTRASTSVGSEGSKGCIPDTRISHQDKKAVHEVCQGTKRKDCHDPGISKKIKSLSSSAVNAEALEKEKVSEKPLQPVAAEASKNAVKTISQKVILNASQHQISVPSSAKQHTSAVQKIRVTESEVTTSGGCARVLSKIEQQQMLSAASNKGHSIPQNHYNHIPEQHNHLPEIRSPETPLISFCNTESSQSNLFNSENEDMPTPVITEVTSLAHSSNHDMPVITNVMDKAYHMWSPSELCHTNELTSARGGKKKESELQDRNISQMQDIIVLDEISENPTPGQIHCSIGQWGRTKTNSLVSAPLNPRPLVKTSTSENSSSLISRPVVKIPEVSSLIASWQKKFPWMTFNAEESVFKCKDCGWGHGNPLVFTLQNEKDVYLVAGQLRLHQETEYHKTMSGKKAIVSTFFRVLFPILKDHSYKDINDIIRKVIVQCGGKFPGPQAKVEREYFTSYMIKHIAQCIEIKLLKSLAESPFLSIVAVEEKEYAVIRWLNSEGSSEEHLFSSRISCPGELVPMIYYLQRKEIDSRKIVSYSLFPDNMINRQTNEGQLPFRYPPIDICLDWLKKTNFLKNVFSHLEILVKICRSHYSRFSRFAGLHEVLKVEEPYSSNCAVNEKIVDFYLNNIAELREICFIIHCETGNPDALYFSRLQVKNFDSVRHCVSLLPKIYQLLTVKNYTYAELNLSIKNFRTSICQKLKELRKGNPDETLAFSILDMYFSHIIISITSSDHEIAEVFRVGLRHVTTKHLEKVFPKLMIEFNGGSSECLQNLHALRVQLAESRDTTITDLLWRLIKRPDLCEAFPHLFTLYEKIAVLPFLHAQKEQYMFNLAVAELFLCGKMVDESLIPSLSLILLEGPPLEEMDIEEVLNHWSKKWRPIIK